MGCSSSSTGVDPVNTNDVPVKDASSTPQTAAVNKVAVIVEPSQSRAEGQPKGQSHDTKVAVADVEPITVPSTPVTIASRTMVSTNDLSSPTPSTNGGISARGVATATAAAGAGASGNKLRPSSASVLSAATNPSTPAGRRVASAGTLRNPVLASLSNDNHTLSPIADCPHTPSSPVAVAPSLASPTKATSSSNAAVLASPVAATPSSEGLATVAGEKVALKAMAGEKVATLTKKEVNRQAMFIPWEKPALGKPTIDPNNKDNGITDRPTTSSGRPTTSGGRKPAVPANLDRLMNKTHKPSKHKREQMAAAAAAAGGAPTEAKSGELMIVGAAIGNGNDINKENKNISNANEAADAADDKKTKRPQPLKRRLAPLAPIGEKPSLNNTAMAPPLSVPMDNTSRPTTSSGRPTTSSGRPGTSSGRNVAPHADTMEQMRRDRDRAVAYTAIERLLVDVHSLPMSVSQLILKLGSISPPAATPFELVKPKQPPAWEIRF